VCLIATTAICAFLSVGPTAATTPVASTTSAASAAHTTGNVDKYCNNASGFFKACGWFNTKYEVTPTGPNTMMEAHGSLANSPKIKKVMLGIGYQSVSCLGCNPLAQKWTNWQISTYPNGDGALSGSNGYYFGCNNYAYRPLMKYEYIDPKPKNHYVTITLTGSWFYDSSPCQAFHP
jgi:hypothetical protein